MAVLSPVGAGSSHSAFLVRMGEAAQPGSVCLVSCVSFSLFSLTTYPVTQQDVLIVNTQVLSNLYEKLSKTSKRYVKNVPWTSDGSELTRCRAANWQ